MMTQRDNEIYRACREYSDDMDRRTAFSCGARWADENPNALEPIKTYTYKTNEGEKYSSVHYLLEEDAKLWTIQYAKAKEQRDLLFQKMHEAGYEWDAEKKELKKIEQKPIWSEDDESMCIRTLGILGKCYIGELPIKVEEELNWLKSLKQRMKGE